MNSGTEESGEQESGETEEKRNGLELGHTVKYSRLFLIT